MGFKKFNSLIVLIFVSLFSISALAGDCIFYFYGDDCQTCQSTNQFISDLKIKNPSLHVEQFEVHYNYDNYEILQNYFSGHSLPKASQGLPVVFTSESYFVGEKPIQELLEQHILENNEEICPTSSDNILGVVGEHNSADVFSTLNFGNVLIASFNDAFRPLMLALIICLLVLIMRETNRKDLLKQGILFIVGIYFGYFMYAIGFFSSLAVINHNFFTITIAFLALLFGLNSLKDFFYPQIILFGKKSKTQKLQEKLQQKLAYLTKNIMSSVGIVVLGFLLSLFSLNGFNKTFLILRSLFIVGRTGVLPIILIYLLNVIILLVIILVVVYFTTKKLELHAKTKKQPDLWQKYNLKMLRFSLSVIIFILGIILFFI